MLVTLLISLIYFAFSYYILSYVNKSKNKNLQTKKGGFWILLPLFLIVRIIFAANFDGYPTDMNCFHAWSRMIYNDGFANFYTSKAFTDYPPGYMYILYLIGFLINTFKLETHTIYILLKIPAIICDILCGYLIYKLAKEKFSEKLSLMLVSTFMLNPAIITNSSVWGQVDSVLTVFILLTLYLLYKERLYASYFVYVIALIIKPQALFYGPVLLFGLIENVFLKDFSWKKTFTHLGVGILAIASGFLLFIPFGVENVINQYIATLSSYKYASVNAYNLWAGLGMNYIKPTFFVSLLGYLSIIITVIVAWVIFSKKKESRYFYTAAFICICVFMLSTKMHERYAYPAIVLMLAAFLISKKQPDFYIYIILSIMQFLNYIHVLYNYDPKTCFQPEYKIVGVLLGLISVALFVFYYRYSLKGSENENEKATIKG